MIVEAGGVGHWVRVLGERHPGPPVVMVHGGPGTSAWSLEPLGERLAERVPVVLYDQRGCGRSGVPDDPGTYTFAQLTADLDELRAALGHQRVVLWGHSFGAVLAAEYAVAHPQRVDRMVLGAPPIAGPLHPGALALQPAALDAHAEPGTRAALRAAFLVPGDPLTRLRAGHSALSRAERERFTYRRTRPVVAERERPTAPLNAVMAERLLGALRPQLADDLARVDVPTLVTVGLWDGHVGVDTPRDLVVRLPRASLRVFAGSAHAPHEEEPGDYLAAVHAFLAS